MDSYDEIMNEIIADFQNFDIRINEMHECHKINMENSTQEIMRLQQEGTDLVKEMCGIQGQTKHLA